MRNMAIETILLAFGLLTHAQSQEIQDKIWSIQSLLEIDSTTAMKPGEVKVFPSTPYKEPSPFAPSNTTDIRVKPTTNTHQSEMSIFVSPLNKNVVLASANTAVYPLVLGGIYGTGAYWSTD